MPTCPECKHEWPDADDTPVETKTSEQSPIEVDGKNLIFEQIAFTDDKPRIDREAGVLHRVHVMGPSSKITVIGKGQVERHRYAIDGMRKAAMRFEQMVVGIDHDKTRNEVDVGNAWGTLQAPIEVDENGIWADLAYIKSHEQTENILEAIERGINKVSLSPVLYLVREQGKTILEFYPVRTDVVINSATTEGRMFEQAVTVTPPVEDKRIDDVIAEVAALKEANAALVREQAEIKADYKARSMMYEQMVTGTTVEQTIQQVEEDATKKFDLRAFFDKHLPKPKT